MSKFQKLTLQDIPEIKPYFSHALNRASDNTVGAVFMWRDFLKTEFAIFDGCLVFKVTPPLADQPRFSFPLGKNPIAGLAAVGEYCRNNRFIPLFSGITQTQMPYLNEAFGKTESVSVRDFFDYLYLAEPFKTFAGKNLHGQRNHFNYFMREYADCSFEEIGVSNLPEVRAFFESGAIKDKPGAIYREEREKTAEVLQNYADYGMVGGVLKVAGRVVGFSVGEISGDTLFIHIEKADTAYRGAYQALLSRFVCRFGAGAQYVNREEDVGDEGLRQSKLAYHPCELIEKAMVKVISP